MSEDEYIAELENRWPQQEEATLETIALANEATRQYQSATIQRFCPNIQQSQVT